MHHIWNDNARTYVITGKLGERKLAIRESYAGLIRSKQIKIEDDIKPFDIVFVENKFSSNNWDATFIGYNVFIAGRLFTLKDQTTPDVQFVENPYLKSANTLMLLGKFLGASTDEEIFQAIIEKLNKNNS